MVTLIILHEGATGPNDIRRVLQEDYQVEFISLDAVGAAKPKSAILVDVSLRSAENVLKVKDWLADKGEEAIALFVVDPSSHHEISQAFSLGAAAILHRPIDVDIIATKLATDFVNLSICPATFAKSSGGTAAVDALMQMHVAVHSGKQLSVELLFKAGGLVAQEIAVSGISPWIELVQKHHSRTYRHSLLVGGISAAFAQHLGFSSADQNWLTSVGLMHDVGKARIPFSLLEKPTALSVDERTIMQRHPQLGVDVLSASNFDPQIIEAVRNHHEYLDGSGYPRGLLAPQISDRVRMITIADVFAALIEQRSYKPALPAAEAYEMIKAMGAKVDSDLVREFRFMSEITINRLREF